ncbi:TetR/AcrR family transcriptional regulator [Lysobacter koreensis]|uniref:TetR/AcrR family transcriptional regulator n=1 Tax=Lysobacter koreensis TaxID=266122 RepID=A0ABW2YIH3_9GAMM
MNALTATAKGAATREAIIDRAHEIARFCGVEGLSIGPLAQAVGMSKSGVFAHFGSREELQLAVIESAATRFGNAVLIPALSQPRGLPRLRAIMDNWFEWIRGNAGGCVLMGSVTEYDDRPGPLRDQVVRNEQRWREALGRSIQQAIEAGHLRDGDAEQYTFELYAFPLTVHHESGLFGYESARRRGEAAVERWLIAHSPDVGAH